MDRKLYPGTFAATFVLSMAIAPFASAADLPVRVILATEKNAPLTAQQEWHKAFERARMDDLQIRQARPGDKPKIENIGTDAAPRYEVTGIVTSGNELFLPGAKFKSRDTESLNAWLSKLRTGGLDKVQGEGQPFGLSPHQIDLVNVDLARANRTKTQGADLRAVLREISAQLKHPVMLSPAVVQIVSAAEPVRDELAGVSCGTAIAAALRPAALVMRPQMNAKRELQYLVTAPHDGQEAWPVGWKLEGLGRDILPELYDARTIELDEVSVKETLEAISERVKAPVLYDHTALARWGLDPAEVTVDMPEKQTSYSVALNKALFQAQLKYELRTDEARNPFLWVTSVKPVR